MNAIEYRDELSKLEKIRGIIPNDAKLKLPQFVVIGDQSSGKSSVLSEISGLTFPTNSGICTKCPIIVHTKLNNDLDEQTFEISCNGKSEVINFNELNEKITEYQQYNIGDSKVTKNPIKITAEGKNLEDLVLIDLPGIIHNGEGKEDVIDMINEYIKPEESLVLVITEADKDNEGDESFKVVRFNPKDKLMESILLKFTSEVLLAKPNGELVIKEAPSNVKVLVILNCNPIELVTSVVVPGTKLMLNESLPR